MNVQDVLNDEDAASLVTENEAARPHRAGRVRESWALAGLLDEAPREHGIVHLGASRSLEAVT
jgi:hypothetical protein